MARGRMISRSLGSSRKFASLHQHAGKLGEFAQSLYPLLVASSDDHGRMAGDAFTVKHAVFPTSPRRESDFAQALTAMQKAGLIELYETRDTVALQIVEFDKHQSGLHRRTESNFPPASAEAVLTPLSASEKNVEDFLAAEIYAGRLRFGSHTVVSVDQQVRIRQFYLDIVAKTESGTTIVVEVKRQRVTTAALEQVRGYIGLIDGDVEAVTIGHGLAAGLDVAVSDVLIGVYDDSLSCRPINHAACARTFQHAPEIPPELNRTRTEVKRTELNTTALTRSGTPEGFEDFWSVYPKKKSRADAEKAWRKVAPSPELFQRIMAAVVAQRGSSDWIRESGRFVPYAATWLNNARWEDSADEAAPHVSKQTLTLTQASQEFLRS